MTFFFRNNPSCQNMTCWPQELESLLQQAGVPSAALDISLGSYVDIICALLDIPIYKSRIQVGSCLL